jgi:hypothetical protein
MGEKKIDYFNGGQIQGAGVEDIAKEDVLMIFKFFSFSFLFSSSCHFLHFFYVS